MGLFQEDGSTNAESKSSDCPVSEQFCELVLLTLNMLTLSYYDYKKKQKNIINGALTLYFTMATAVNGRVPFTLLCCILLQSCCFLL